MNERIKELAEQVGIKFSPFTVDGEEYDFDEVQVEDSDMLEKFAQLIVNECCERLVKQGEGWEEFAKNPPPGQEHNASGALFAAYRLKEDAVWDLKEHFGVK